MGNELKPKRQRAYFSRPQSLPELQQHLVKQGPGGQALLKRHNRRRESPPITPSRITADAEPSLCPERHELGGNMMDRDGEVRAWNDRWSSGVHSVNDLLHPAHRVRFSSPSVFERAESQLWRRQQHSEVARCLEGHPDTEATEVPTAWCLSLSVGGL